MSSTLTSPASGVIAARKPAAAASSALSEPFGVGFIVSAVLWCSSWLES